MSKPTPSGDEEYDWLYDYIVTFLKSPPWTVPINRFIDDHCIVFDNDEENKLSFTEIHLKFIELVESLLTKNLSEIGVTEEQFASACAKGSNTALKELVFQQLMAVDDYQIFKKMMVKRNTELELDAMKVLQRAEKHITNKNNNKDKGKSSTPSAPIAVGDGELSEELQLELALQLSTNPEFLGAIKSSEPIEEVDEAIKASLLAAELYQKELQREQAELEHAMALSMALEQERMKLLQIADNQDDNKKKASQPSSVTTTTAAAAPTTPSTSSPTSQPPASKPSPIAPSSGQSSAAPSVAVPSSSSTHPSSSAPSSHTPSSSTPSSTPSSVSSSTLPPVRTSSTLTSSSLPPLKSTKSSLDSSSSSIPDSLSAKTEEFLYAKRVQEEKKKEAIAAGQSTSSMGGLSSEELERRKQFLKAQKEKIIAMRNKERDAELKKYVEENQSMAKQLKSNVSAAAASAASDKKDTTDTTTTDDVEKTREAYRLALAKRLKQDYYDTERRRLETAVAEKFALIQEQLKKVEKVHDEQLLNTIKQQQKSLEIDRQKLDALQKMHQNIAANKLDAASENFHM